MSDDGHFALMEIVAATKVEPGTALAAIRAHMPQTPAIQVFERGIQSRAEIAGAFQAKKRDFDFGRFRLVVP